MSSCRMKLWTLSFAIGAIYLTGANSYQSSHPASGRNNNRPAAPWDPRGGSSVKQRRRRRPRRPSGNLVDLTRLRSSTALNFPTRRRGILQSPQPSPVRTSSQHKPTRNHRQRGNTIGTTSSSSWNRHDVALFVTYFCTCISQTLPFLILPFIASEQTAVHPSTFVTTVASFATLAGGAGKLVNGFVCQALGGQRSSFLYLAGMSFAWMSLATLRSPRAVPYLCAALEFGTSIQWVACSLLMAKQYKQPHRLAQAMTCLSLASTTGVLMGKFGGAAALQWLPHWRAVAGMGAAVTALACGVMRWAVVTTTNEPPRSNSRTSSSSSSNNHKNSSSRTTATSSSSSSSSSPLVALQQVCGRPLFWVAALAHACAYLARTSDRVLGAYFGDATNMSRGICGLLTASVTLGFGHGLRKAAGFYQLPNLAAKLGMLRTNYQAAVLCTLGLAVVAAQPWIMAAASPLVLAVLAFFCSGAMASSLSFAFYQIPPQIAAVFGENRAVCIAFLDAMGFFLSALVWGVTGKMVAAFGPQWGWTAAFGMVGGLFGLGGYLMLQLYPQVVRQQPRG